MVQFLWTLAFSFQWNHLPLVFIRILNFLEEEILLRKFCYANGLYLLSFCLVLFVSFLLMNLSYTLIPDLSSGF